MYIRNGIEWSDKISAGILCSWCWCNSETLRCEESRGRHRKCFYMMWGEGRRKHIPMLMKLPSFCHPPDRWPRATFPSAVHDHLPAIESFQSKSTESLSALSFVGEQWTHHNVNCIRFIDENYVWMFFFNYFKIIIKQHYHHHHLHLRGFSFFPSLIFILFFLLYFLHAFQLSRNNRSKMTMK